MPLEKYQQKRKFDSTPEPSGAKAKRHKQLRFVIQKHHASHLHYDFRLEMGGVLKSWAIPKGPSLNPADKRLGIMVEDHPYAYKDFEGIIPKGNYGAGNVIIWDEGTYEPAESTKKDAEKELLQDLKNGQLNFILHGKKLCGEFTLVKLRDDSKNPKSSWLLVKKNDEYATKDHILKQEESVRSKKKLDVADKKVTSPKSAVSSSETKMPSNVKPMLAKLVGAAFDREDWLFEIKWDGFRIISYVTDKESQLISRNGKDYTKTFAPVSKELSNLNLQAIMDGEIVVVNKEGHSEFQLLQQFQKTGKGQLIYYVFDLLWLNEQDLRGLPLIERKALLKKNLPKLTHVRISDHIAQKGKEFFKAATTHNLEGIMAKNANSFYLEGHRSSNWLKIKTKKRQEAVICGYTAPKGSRQHLGALVLGLYENKELKYIGHTGSGFNHLTLSDIKKRLDKLTEPTSPFKKPPKTNAPVTWIKPQLVCEVKFSEWTEDGQMRQPIFIGLREDKPARSVTHERVESAPVEHTQHSKKAQQETHDETKITINQHTLRLTHLDKIYWPDEGYTKGDLIAYYRSIASIILPYLKDRPQALNRHPDGITGFHFYQKNVEDAPRWMKTKTFYAESEDHDVRYIICQDEATLTYMVNLGCIELNPWLSRIQSPENPDFCVIDLDPENIGFEAVVETAKAVHMILEKIGAANYCKTSGATGLHICIPLGAKYSFEQSRQFAELIATIANTKLPHITSIIRSPKERQGKVYLDYLQNRHHQTIVAPYSVRPRSKAPVSTPLLWREVNKRLNPQQFTIKTIQQRLDEQGDLWKPVLGKGISLSNCIRKLENFK